MEIRAKISLAVESFKQNAKIVSSTYGNVAKKAKAADDYISKSAKTGAASRRAFSEQSANGQMAAIRKVEKAAIESNKRIQTSYNSIKPNKLPLPLVQQSVRSTFSATTSTQGLPERKTAEYRYELETKIAKLRKEADEKSIKAAEAALKVALTEASYKKRGYSAGKPVGMEENLFNLFGKDQSKEAEKLARAREKANQKMLADTQRRIDKEQAANEKLVNSILKGQQKVTNFSEHVRFFNSKEFERSMASTRYALYDIGQRALGFGIAIDAALVQAVQQSAKFESAFTSVERTTGVTGAAVGELKKQLIDLSTTVPVTFDQIARIATLGAQMGISADAVDGFAETISKFSTLTGIDVESVSMSFGRLAQMMDVPVSQFENLSSSLLYTGVNAVATDREILAMAESIAVAGTQSGMSTDQVIGFSAALASLKVRPEEARGVITRLFRTIDIETSNGGTAINDFGKVLGYVTDAAGTAGEKAAALWKQNPSQFFTAFLKGANAAGNLNQVIQSLGITNTRELRVIQSLANNTDVLASSLSDAREQYLLGDYAATAYSKVQDDLQSKLTILQSAFEALQASIGDVFNNDALKGFIDGISATLKALSEMSPVTKGFAIAIAAIVASFAIFTGTTALGIAGLLALKLALKNLGDETVKASISFGTFRALLQSVTGQAGFASGALSMLGVAAKTTDGSVKVLGMSLKALSWSMAAVTAAFIVIPMIIDWANASQKAAQANAELKKSALEAAGGIDVFGKAIRQDTKAYQEAKKANSELADSYSVVKVKTDSAALAQQALKDGTLSEAEALLSKIDALDSTSSATDAFGTNIDALAASQQALNDETQRSIDLTKEQEIAFGAATEAAALASLRKYAKGNGQTGDFIAEVTQSNKSKAILATAKAFGFDYAEMVHKGMTENGGAEKYMKLLGARFTGFAQQMQLSLNPDTTSSQLQTFIAELGKRFNYTSEEVKALQNAFSGLNGQQALAYLSSTELPANYAKVAKHIDALRESTIDAAAADTEWASSGAAAVTGVADVGDEAMSTSEIMKQYIDSLSAVNLANAATANSFGSFYEGIQSGNGDITKSTKESTDALSNWNQFMQDAFEASQKDGSDTVGVMQRISGAIIVLGKSGKNTSGQLSNLVDIMKKAYGAALTGSTYGNMFAELAKAPDLTAMNAIIDGYIAIAKAAGAAGAAQLAALEAIKNGLSGNDFAKTFQDYMKGITSSAGTAKTALEKLQEQITKTFAAMRNKMSLTQSINDLGNSLRENGKAFNTWSEAGRSNTDALLTVIDNLAVKSNGNLNKFGSDLKSLRKALIATGNGSPQALALIDKELRKIGKAGKASKTDIDSFAKSLSALSNQKSGIEGLVERINNLADAVMNYLNARWQMANTQLEIAAGWEAIANKAKDAADAITEAKNKLMEINANKAILQAQLEVAIRYGDTLRADQLRAEIAKLEQDAADAQKKANGGGTASDLLEQQKALQGMVQYYVQMGAADVVNAKSKEEAKAAVDATVKSFEDQARAAGVSEENIKTYSDELRKGLEMAKKINEPAKYKVDAQTAQALKDIYAFRDKATEAINKIPKTVTVTVKTKTAKAEGGLALATGGIVSGAGGPTSDSIPAMLSNGEYVVKAAAVNTYGVDFMNSINNMKVSAPSIGGQIAAAVGGSGGMVYLSPEDRALLRAAIDRPVNLYADNTKIAQSANAGNIVLAKRGAR